MMHAAKLLSSIDRETATTYPGKFRPNGGISISRERIFGDFRREGISVVIIRKAQFT